MLKIVFVIVCVFLCINAIFDIDKYYILLFNKYMNMIKQNDYSISFRYRIKAKIIGYIIFVIYPVTACLLTLYLVDIFISK